MPKQSPVRVPHCSTCPPKPRRRGKSEVGTSPHSQLLSNFHKFDNAPDAIPRLRRFILDLAVRGKLVKQDPNDEPASELPKRIAAEKERLVKEKKIKRPKVLPPIEAGEVPFEIPDGWECIRFSELATEVLTGPFGSMVHKSDYTENGIPLINPSHMTQGLVKPDPRISVSNVKAKALNSYVLQTGDMVMARRGEMGRCAIVTDDLGPTLCGTGSFILRFHKDVSRVYIYTLFKSKYVVTHLGGNSVGATMTNLNHGILNSMPIVLPPAPEQKRIVAKVDELMALCDRLEAAQAEGNKQRNRLVAATHHQINLPACRQDRPDSKAGDAKSNAKAGLNRPACQSCRQAGRQEISYFTPQPSHFTLHVRRTWPCSAKPSST